MKATQQNFPLGLYKMVPTFESVDETNRLTTHIKATERYFPVLLFIIVLTTDVII